MAYSAEEYFKKLDGKKVICVDFDNTIGIDEWPYVGDIVPGADVVLKKLKKEGNILILHTQRTENYPTYEKSVTDFCDDTNLCNEDGSADLLAQPLALCELYGIKFDYINKNPEWEKATDDNSRKIFADYTIDDHSVGMKYRIIKNKEGNECKTVDWKFVDKWLVQEGVYKESAFEK